MYNISLPIWKQSGTTISKNFVSAAALGNTWRHLTGNTWQIILEIPRHKL
jgi:hypothetical protein